MLNVEIHEGAFYGQTHHRHDVIFDKALRTEAEEAAKKVHVLIESGILLQKLNTRRNAKNVHCMKSAFQR